MAARCSTLDCRTQPASQDVIIRNMVGREMADRYPRREPKIGETVFELRDWTVHHPQHAERQVVKGVNLQLARGEIVGIAGLMGAGRTELAMSVFGRSYGQRISGKVLLHGKEVDVSTVECAVRLGIAYVTEDRQGLRPAAERRHRPQRLAGQPAGGVAPWRDRRRPRIRRRRRLPQAAAQDPLFRRVPDDRAALRWQNQQKVMLGKWLFTQPQVLVLDEPTRGIDVGAKFEIYSLMAQMAAEGKSIIMISSEMPELLGMCDRIYVMNEGRFVAEFDGADASQEAIMHSIVNSSGGLQ